MYISYDDQIRNIMLSQFISGYVIYSSICLLMGLLFIYVIASMDGFGLFDEKEKIEQKPKVNTGEISYLITIAFFMIIVTITTILNISKFF